MHIFRYGGPLRFVAEQAWSYLAHAKGLFFKRSRDVGTACKMRAQSAMTVGVILARLLKEPKVTKPFVRAGRGDTGGASAPKELPSARSTQVGFSRVCGGAKGRRRCSYTGNRVSGISSAAQAGSWTSPCTVLMLGKATGSNSDHLARVCSTGSSPAAAGAAR